MGDHLQEYFSRFGNISECFIVNKRGFGFVTFKTYKRKNLEALNHSKHTINGKECDVKPAQPKPQGGSRGRGGHFHQGRGGYGGYNQGAYGRGYAAAYGGYGA